MRQRNIRLVTVGSVLFLAAITFFMFVMSIASKSTNPVELMQTVGTVSGVVGGLAIAMVVMGLVGRKSAVEPSRLRG